MSDDMASAYVKQLERERDRLEERLAFCMADMRKTRIENETLREQVKQYKESLRLVGQLRRAEG